MQEATYSYYFYRSKLFCILLLHMKVLYYGKDSLQGRINQNNQIYVLCITACFNSNKLLIIIYRSFPTLNSEVSVF